MPTSIHHHSSPCTWIGFRQCCSCLFVSGRTVVYRSHFKRPQFPPKIDFGGPNCRLQRLMLRLMLTGPAGLCWRLDRPGRTPSTCVAWQLQHWVQVTTHVQKPHRSRIFQYDHTLSKSPVWRPRDVPTRRPIYLCLLTAVPMADLMGGFRTRPVGRHVTPLESGYCGRFECFWNVGLEKCVNDKLGKKNKRASSYECGIE